MPSKTSKQRRFMGMALGMKRGETPQSTSPSAAKAARSMTVGDLRDFAGKPVMKKKQRGKAK